MVVCEIRQKGETGLVGGHVLIVEDEQNIVESLSFLLRREGFAVTAVLDGAKAVQSIGQHRPDLLILDLMLPGVDGFQILSEVRALPEFVGLPVIVLTAKLQDHDRQRARDIGANAFMAKPFANADVLSTVKGLLPNPAS